MFVTDQKIKTLNQRYLKHNHPTDVLAFHWQDTATTAKASCGVSKKMTDIEGEIIVSTDTVLRNSKTYQTTAAQELNLCVIHGLLHLLGYDDHTPKQIERMRQKEKELLNLISR